MTRTAGGPARAGIDPDDPTPLYHQLFLLYRQKILTGELAGGARLPSEEALSSLHNVSRITAKRAMNELAGARLVVRNRGRGTVVADTVSSRAMQADFAGLVDTLVEIDATTRLEVLSFDYVAAPPEIADALELPADAPVQRVERRRMHAGVPFSSMLTYLPEDIGRTFDRGALGSRPILALIEAAGHRIGAAAQSVTAVLADRHLSSVLDVAVGSPLLRVRRLVRDTRRRPVQHIVVHYRPDAYQLDMTLERVDGGEAGQIVWSTTNSGV